MILLSFTTATVKFALFAMLMGALIMFMSWLRVKKTEKKGFMGLALLWGYFLIQLFIVLCALAIIVFIIRIIFS